MKECIMLIVLGIIIGLVFSVGQTEQLPTNPVKRLTNKGIDVPMIKKDTLATDLRSKPSSCDIFCDSAGFCQSEEFYRCIQQSDDVNFGLVGRQRSAFHHQRRMQADTTAY